MFLLDIVGGLVAAVMVVGPALYLAQRTRHVEQSPSFPLAVTVALTGLFVGGLVDALVGWLPVVGPFFSPLAWALVVSQTMRTRLPVGLALGFLGWAITVAFYAFLTLV